MNRIILSFVVLASFISFIGCVEMPAGAYLTGVPQVEVRNWSVGSVNVEINGSGHNLKLKYIAAGSTSGWQEISEGAYTVNVETFGQTTFTAKNSFHYAVMIHSNNSIEVVETSNSLPW